MTRRLLSTACLVLSAVISWPATPSGQHFPTLSGDLALHPAGHRGHRVIVQADAGTLLASARRSSARVSSAADRRCRVRRYRRRARRAAARIPRSRTSPGTCRYVADMAVTNKVTGREHGVAGDAGTARALAVRPATPGRASASPILDSGIAIHTALDSARRRARQPGVGRAGRHGRSVRPRHAHRRDHRRQHDRRVDVTPAFAGGSAPAVQLDRRARARLATARAAPATSSPASTGRSPTARRYNIRVINLSLGHPVTEPSATDPLCQAVARAVAAGIVVVGRRRATTG